MPKATSPKSCGICQHHDVCIYRKKIQEAVDCFDAMLELFDRHEASAKQVKTAEQADISVLIATEHITGQICPHFKAD